VILDPVILALLAGSALVVLLSASAAVSAFQILRRWQPQSGEEGQLRLERKTYLVSVLLAYVFGFELLSFFLFIHTADGLSRYFTGAMCAAGSLNVNGFGYPALLAKLLVSLLAGVWLVLNRVDTRAEDYPLIRTKYRYFLWMAPLVLAEAVLQAAYFIRLDPDLITSCCGTLFGAGTSPLPLATGWALRGPAMGLFYATMAAAVGTGLYYHRSGKGGQFVAPAGAAAFVVAIVAVFSFISVYIYELPTHHCPFCMLKREYGFVGYGLYAALFGGGILAASVGILSRYEKVPSLSSFLPRFRRRMALAAALLFAAFALLATLRILASNLTIR
jgi:hypothetical protein